MKKIVARALKDEALHKNRRQMIRLHKRSGKPAKITQVTEVSEMAVKKVFDFMKLVVQLN
ncbi:MAG: hypothetical protein IPP22_16995 [Nitrosomonas sp.]|nr:hypothetical protein [Nitrosomonas sp.]